MAKPVSKHTAKQPGFYMKPITMHQDKIYMPKSIMRPEGFHVEKMSSEESLVIDAPKTLEEPTPEVKETKKAKSSTKKEA